MRKLIGATARTPHGVVALAGVGVLLLMLVVQTATYSDGGVYRAAAPIAEPAGTVRDTSTAPGDPAGCQPSKGKRACITLLAPLGSKDKIDVSPGIGTFMDYFADISGWLFEAAVGFCVLWILIGGYMIMISGSDGGKRSTGKGMITWAIIGLLVINFAGFFLRLLNDIFFV